MRSAAASSIRRPASSRRALVQVARWRRSGIWRTAAAAAAPEARGTRRTRWTGRWTRRFRARRTRPRAERVQRAVELHLRRIGARQRAVPTASRSSAQQTPYSRQSFGVTLGGPVRIPGIYKGDRRTNFMASYPGTAAAISSISTPRSRPRRCAPAISPSIATPADRSGHRCAVRRQSDSCVAHRPGVDGLLRFIPLPNLDGTDRNFHYVTTNQSTLDNVNLRVTHSFTQNTGRGGPGGRGGGGGGRGGFGGAGGRARTRAAGHQRQHDGADAVPAQRSTIRTTCFRQLSGEAPDRAFTVPVSLNIQHRRTMHNVNVNFSRTEAQHQ